MVTTGAVAEGGARSIEGLTIEAGRDGYTAVATADSEAPLTVRIVVDLHAAYPREDFKKVERWWSNTEVAAGAPASAQLTVPEGEVAEICERYGRCRLHASARSVGEGAPPGRASDRLKVEVGPERPSGDPVLVDGTSPKVGSGRSYEYAVYVEGGVRVDRESFADEVGRILSADRGWTASGAVSFRRVSSRREANTRIILASGDLVDRLCFPLDTDGRVSCRNGDDVVLNLDRWRRGSGDFATRTAYRQYLVNHEVGHRIGQFHRYCSEAGDRAAVMQQQTSSSAPCRPGSWPKPSELASLP